MQKLIAIVGPTASGKTAYSIELALRVGGEIINADSRQIYAGFPATTAKPSPEELAAVPHHLLGTHPIDAALSVAQYQELARNAIDEIAARGKVPILVGGTGHWVDAVVYGQQFPPVPPDPMLRSELSARSAASLYAEVVQKDPRRAATLDPKNVKRLIRALEIIETAGAVPEMKAYPPQYAAEQVGIRWQDARLRQRIESRTDLLLAPMLAEARAGLASLSDERAQELGFDFTIPRAYLRGEFASTDEFLMRLKAARWQYAKRQMRWFKRNPDIRWVSGEGIDVQANTGNK